MCIVRYKPPVGRHLTNETVIAANGLAILGAAPEIGSAGGRDEPSILHRGDEKTGCTRPIRPPDVPSVRYRVPPGGQSSTVRLVLSLASGSVGWEARQNRLVAGRGDGAMLAPPATNRLPALAPVSGLCHFARRNIPGGDYLQRLTPTTGCSALGVLSPAV